MNNNKPIEPPIAPPDPPGYTTLYGSPPFYTWPEVAFYVCCAALALAAILGVFLIGLGVL